MLWLHLLQSAPGPQDLACLSAGELERAARFVLERDRRRYLAARCVLRQRLSQHLGVPAGDLRIVQGPFGKPHLADAPRCHFNLSHSAELALLGVSDACEIGVDIEALRRIDDAEALAHRHFTPVELDALRRAGDASRDEIFLRVWTRKEACLKALGLGLSLEPSAVEAGSGPGLAHLTIQAPSGPARMAVASVDAGAAALAAVAWME